MFQPGYFVHTIRDAHVYVILCFSLDILYTLLEMLMCMLFYVSAWFTTTCAISAYHHWCCEFEPRSWRGLLNTLCDSLSVTCDRSVVFSTNKTDHHDITEILLKVVCYFMFQPGDFVHTIGDAHVYVILCFSLDILYTLLEMLMCMLFYVSAWRFCIHYWRCSCVCYFMFQPGDFVHTIGDAHVYVNRHNFEREPSKDHSSKVWFKLAQWFLRRRLKCEKLTTDDWRQTDNGRNPILVKTISELNEIALFSSNSNLSIHSTTFVVH
jgi:hypothetical protein